ncbi:MAG: hypothetical protein C0490_24900 [Marivirga sp.]|nr:hypothetical protein [Marivirga sp.]
MKAYILLIAISIFLTYACIEDQDPGTVCSVLNPVEELDWLAAEILVMAESGMAHYLYVSQAEYGFTTVFIFGNCCPNCSTIVPVYNCLGEHIGNVGDGIDDNILNNDIIIWKPDNSSCTFQ